MIDLSHTSTSAQQAVLEVSKAPVIFSHSAWYVHLYGVAIIEAD